MRSGHTSGNLTNSKPCAQFFFLTLETDGCLKVAYLRSVSLFPLFSAHGKARQDFLWKKKGRYKRKPNIGIPLVKIEPRIFNLLNFRNYNVQLIN